MEERAKVDVKTKTLYDYRNSTISTPNKAVLRLRFGLFENTVSGLGRSIFNR